MQHCAALQMIKSHVEAHTPFCWAVFYETVLILGFFKGFYYASLVLVAPAICPALLEYRPQKGLL